MEVRKSSEEEKNIIGDISDVEVDVKKKKEKERDAVKKFFLT